ncbi:MAG: helix-turn-helix transcriptional regulator [Clostridia bacterium]|nr:helix-turn-helix transcriptional regulator [Clostridia bacterium]
MKDVKTIVAKNLTMLRKNKGLTQAELAEKLNYSDKAISRWEHGETLPDINVLYDICCFYEITMNDLVDPDCEIEEVDQNEKNAKSYRIWLCALSGTMVWLCATVWFVCSMTVFNNPYWVAFIWAIPASCMVVMHMGKSIFNWVVKFILSSVNCWTLITAIYLHILVTFNNPSMWLIFVIGLPIQAIVFLWGRMKKYRNN